MVLSLYLLVLLIEFYCYLYKIVVVLSVFNYVYWELCRESGVYIYEMWGFIKRE